MITTLELKDLSIADILLLRESLYIHMEHHKQTIKEDMKLLYDTLNLELENRLQGLIKNTIKNKDNAETTSNKISSKS